MSKAGGVGFRGQDMITVQPLLVAIEVSQDVRPGQSAILIVAPALAVPRPSKKLFNATKPMAVRWTVEETLSPVAGSLVSDVQ